MYKYGHKTTFFLFSQIKKRHLYVMISFQISTLHPVFKRKSNFISTARVTSSHHYFFFYIYKLFFVCLFLIYFWLCWVFFAVCWLSLVAASRGYSSLQCVGFSCSGFSCCGAQALGTWASVVVARRLSCSVACGIFPDQGSNPCPLHWQVDS